ncbi:unnamed protein product [Ectocarpus sp. CCAP 1310/34]|nr:unnamed protein product [Ectocarpus sp. CCAP 1310/34]
MLLARQTYAAMAEIVVKQLPTGARLIDWVGERLRVHWMGQVPEYKHIVVGLLDVQEVKDAILGWWGVLVGALVENSKKPPSSKRALAYEKKREEERFPKQEEFSSEPSIVRKALELGVDSRRVAHKLTCVFGAIDEVADKTLTQQTDAAHLVKVAYPAEDVDLDVHQRRLVYNIAGWLLSSALSRVSRQRSLGSAFLPFFNSHKVASAEEFREAYPHFSGLEFVVEERNNPWEGKGLIFASADFFLFVRALESGYRSSLLNPALLAAPLSFGKKVSACQEAHIEQRGTLAAAVATPMQPALRNTWSSSRT